MYENGNKVAFEAYEAYEEMMTLLLFLDTLVKTSGLRQLQTLQ